MELMELMEVLVDGLVMPAATTSHSNPGLSLIFFA